MSIAVFDVDNTLLKGDSLYLAAIKSNSPIQLIWYSLNFIPYLIAWKLRFIKTEKVKEIFLKRFKICQKFNLEIINNNHNWFLRYLKNMIRKDALDRINMHKEKGDKIILCSASPDMILEPLAKYLNVEIISTNLLKINNQWIPEIKGLNCKGYEKLRRIEKQYGCIRNENLEVYGDSIGDKEILNAASIPHYRNFSDYPNEYPIFSLTSIIPLIGIIFFVYLIVNSFDNMNSVDKRWTDIWLEILIGESLILISYFIRFIRWKILLKNINLNPPNLRNAYIWMGSFAFTATPGKAGEGVRIILLNKQCKIPKSPILLALLTERFSDAMAVLIIFILNLNIITKINLKSNYSLILIIIIISLFFLLFNKREKIKDFIIFIIGKVLPSQKVNFKNKNIKTIKILMKPKNIIISITLGLFAWIIEGISFFIILKGFNLSISWNGATFAHTTSSLLGALTFMPGGLGPTEASTIGLLSLQGIPLAIGTSATLLIRVMTLWFATILGLICLLLNSYRDKQKSFSPKN